MQIFHTWEKCRLADLKNSFYLLIFSTKYLLTRLKEISKVISIGAEGKKVFEKTATPDVLILMFWLGALEFNTCNLPFTRETNV